MENFIFSLNATVPVFLIIVVGYALRLMGKVNDNFCTISNNINYNITLPALLFLDISGANIKEVFDLKYVLFCGMATTICFVSVWGAGRLFVKNKEEIGAFVQGSFRGSAAVLGVAFIQNMYGNSGMAPLMIIGAVPLYNVYSVIVLTFEGNNEGGKNIKSALINICRNPIILSILAGVAVSLADINFPVIIDKTLGSIAAMATPMALLIIGSGFEGRKALAKVKITMVGAIIKLVIQPAIFLPLAALMGFSGDKIIAVLVMVGAPTTASCYIMAKAMNNDTVLTSSLIVTTTLLSSITLTFWIFVLRSLGIC